MEKLTGILGMHDKLDQTVITVSMTADVYKEFIKYRETRELDDSNTMVIADNTLAIADFEIGKQLATLTCDAIKKSMINAVGMSSPRYTLSIKSVEKADELLMLAQAVLDGNSDRKGSVE